jgi:hypothetical protein
MGEICSTRGGDKKYVQNFGWKPEGMYYLVKLYVDGR